ncbi:hypothetical protein LPB140_08870 [Sphingorhabdus lutea]|uniref:Uncharacterized protein n=1 Tax=Sphingorhabdus lutea TaxID=1913578 RepID=A0A1L3JCP2_9SPHN|nr:hypothetical protein LPB140_08870 [Sphingorhabdus lutea]
MQYIFGFKSILQGQFIGTKISSLNENWINIMKITPKRVLDNIIKAILISLGFYIGLLILLGIYLILLNYIFV